MNKEIQEYGTCILFNLLMPILPLFIEEWFSGKITSSSLMMAAAMYAISVGSTSSNKMLFSISVSISVIFSACYGFVMVNDGNNLPTYSFEFAAISVVAILTTSLVEKYAKYVTNKQKCWEFD